MRQKTSSLYAEIEQYLKSNQDSILNPYSPAHLQDLKRSYFQSEKGKKETINDLEYLSTLTSNYCLYYDYKEKTVNPQRFNPLKYFEEIYVENEDFNPFDFESIFDFDDPLGKLWQSYWKLLQLMPSGIDVKEFDKLPSKYGVLKDMFSNTKVNNTFGSLLKDMAKLMQNSEKFETIFKSIREVSNKDMKIKTDTTQWGDPFVYLSEVLRKNKIQKSFFDLTTETINNSNKKASRFDYFSNYYIQLDMFGYNKDKKIPNLIDDAAHSFYGAHCDIFVTDDQNTYRKSKALYKELNISTDIANSNEFFSSIRKKKVYLPEQSIANQVIYFLKNSFLLLNTVDDQLNPARVFKIEPYFKNYFNRMQISEYQDETVLTFHKKTGNYSDFNYWIEIESVVNNIAREYGSDLNHKLEFEDSDKQEINNNNWTGRIWGYEEMSYELDYVEQPFGLVFKIRMKTTGNTWS